MAYSASRSGGTEMALKQYQPGNPEFLEMIHSGQFDRLRAEEILPGVDLNRPIIDPSDIHGFTTTYLFEAVQANNLPAVAFLLDNGAAPNLYIPELYNGSALWELQYIEPEQDWKTRYEIAKLFFRYGADPDLVCDSEALYDYVCYKVFNENPNDKNDWENLRHLFLLLVVYGGGRLTGRICPILKDIDINRIDEYDIVICPHEDGYHLVGKLVDGNGKEIGVI